MIRKALNCIYWCRKVSRLPVEPGNSCSQDLALMLIQIQEVSVSRPVGRSIFWAAGATASFAVAPVIRERDASGPLTRKTGRDVFRKGVAVVTLHVYYVELRRASPFGDC